MQRFEVRESVLCCTSCDLHELCKAPVPFSGPTPNYLAIVGEAPGKVEDEVGQPFVGPAGELLRDCLIEAGIDPDQVFWCNAVSCLRWDTMVLLASGEWKTISGLVKHRYAGEVLSVRPDGEVVPRRVNAWYRNPLAGRQLLRLSYEGARETPKGPSGVTLTEDHLVLTLRGWVEAKDLKPDDQIATGRLGFTERQRQLILAGRLGDGRSTSRTRVVFACHDLERAYAEEKACLLGTSVERSGSGWRVVLRRERALTSLPVDPVQTVRELDDFGMACWFMDDGHLHERQGHRPDGQIAVCRFSLAVAEQMAAALRQKGFSVVAKSSSMGPRLLFDTKGIVSLSQRIAPHTVPSMSYKLLPRDRGLVASWVPERRKVHYARVTISSVAARPHERSVYCLGVEETENFITMGGVVHNCWPHRENHTPTSVEINACSPNLAAQLELADPSWVCLLGGVALSTLRSDLKISRTRGHVLVSDRRHYFVAFHPSYALRNARGEQFLRRDMEALAFMLKADDWSSAATDSCVGCGTDPEQIGEHDLHLRFDDMGVPYCSECWETKSVEGKAQVKEVKANVRAQETMGRLFK